MSDATTKAVFLSYASQDAAVARHICEALRAAGVDVWFDQSELRGGDAWDAKIRRQIKECALFVPIISANTQARREGYFRIEWKLAAQRTHAIAEGTPFLLPLLIDATPEPAALVPAEFREVQWTRGSNDAAWTAFAARVGNVLGADHVPRPALAQGEERKEGRIAPARSSPRRWVFALAAMAGISAATMFWWQSRPPAEAKRPASPAVSAPPRADRPPTAALDRSVAVLPFQNRSDSAANAYFTDGVQEDLATNLTSIRALRVVSGISVRPFRDRTTKASDIARELNVRYLVEGSVQRSGNTARVACQLIDAQTGSQVWGNKYEKDVSDLFALQTEIATAIAGELRAVLSPEEQRQLERRPTANANAYDLYLQARALTETRRSVTLLDRQAELLQNAVELDPDFAEAWAELAHVHASYIDRGFDTSAQRLGRADAAIARALRLAPDSPEVIRRMGDYASEAYEDEARAHTQYLRLLKMQPNDATVHIALANSAWAQRQWRDALASAREATALDPANSTAFSVLVRYLSAVRRWDELIVELTRWLQLRPNDLSVGFQLACTHFRARGDIGPGKQFFSGLSAEQAGTPTMIDRRKQWDFMTGDLAHYLELDRLMPYHPDYVAPDNPEKFAYAIVSAMAYLGTGDRPGAIARLGDLRDQARAQLERQTRNSQVWTSLGLAEALLGDREEALRAGRRAVELKPNTLAWPLNLAIAKAWAGDHDGAIADLDRLLRQPANTLLVQGPLNVHQLAKSPVVAPLKSDPRFQALLNDSKNNAPLF